MKGIFMNIVFAFVIAIACGSAVNAQELIKYKPANSSLEAVEVTALLARPVVDTNQNARLPAVVLLHAGWGWENGETLQYAKALNAAGFVTLEPRLFNSPSERNPYPSAYLPELFGALQYLSSRADVDPKKIAVAGFSQGGSLTVTSATSWAVAKFGGPGAVRFAAHAPVYPVCWAQIAIKRGRMKSSPIPSDAYAKWTGSPMRIFTGALDDYDDRDPSVCANFVNELPEEYKASVSVKVYGDATHGWDQNRKAEFQEPLGCKGRGCMNRNVPNPTVTAQSINDVVAFFIEAVR